MLLRNAKQYLIGRTNLFFTMLMANGDICVKIGPPRTKSGSASFPYVEVFQFVDPSEGAPKEGGPMGVQKMHVSLLEVGNPNNTRNTI